MKARTQQPSIYTVHQAKTQLSRLIEEALRGREVIIARGKTPVAKLVPLDSARQAREPDRLKGKITILPSFYEPMTPEERKEWGME
jgi:prevent-host-death family protein